MRKPGAREIDRPRQHPGGDDHGIESVERVHPAYRIVQPHRHGEPLELGLEVGDRRSEVLLARDPARHPELTPEP